MEHRLEHLLWTQERVRKTDVDVRKLGTDTNRGDIGTKYLEPTRIIAILRLLGLTTRGQELQALKATSRAGAALCATTLAAFFAPGEAAEVQVTIAFPDRAAGASAALVAAITFAVLMISMLWWMLRRRERQARTTVDASTSTTEIGFVNGDDDIDDTSWTMLSDDDDENVTRPTDTTVSGADGRSSMRQAGASSASDGRLAAATRAGGARAAPARGIAPRLAASRRIDAVTEPLSPSQIWMQDLLVNFLRGQLRKELKRRGHSTTGLKDQLARRLVRDSSASADSIWRLAAIMAGNGGGLDSSPLEVLESEQSLTRYLQGEGVARRVSPPRG